MVEVEVVEVEVVVVVAAVAVAVVDVVVAVVAPAVVAAAVVVVVVDESDWCVVTSKKRYSGETVTANGVQRIRGWQSTSRTPM